MSKPITRQPSATKASPQPKRPQQRSMRSGFMLRLASSPAPALQQHEILHAPRMNDALGNWLAFAGAVSLARGRGPGRLRSQEPPQRVGDRLVFALAVETL